MKEITKFLSSDGVEFYSKDECATHEGLHKCPKCNRTGYSMIEYDAYPRGFPDSGFAQDIRLARQVCDVCKGTGYTKNKINAVIETKVVGYR